MSHELIVSGIKRGKGLFDLSFDPDFDVLGQEVSWSEDCSLLLIGGGDKIT